MSQDKDNNEAASALHSAIMNLRADVSNCSISGAAADLSYKQGHRDARHAAAELVAEAASASQSSTAGAAKGGPDEAKTIDTPELREILSVIAAHGDITNHDITRLSDYFLAHVARQCQEPQAYCKACNDVGMSNCGNFDECDGPQCVTCHQKLPARATPSAAVAEGVDPVLPKPRMLGGDLAFDDAVYGYTADDMQEHGAQQREAGRRERDVEVVEAKREGWREGMAEAQELLQAEVDQVPEPLRRLGEYLCGVLDEDEFKTADRMLLGAVKAAALSRQPVSEGLTEERKLLQEFVDYHSKPAGLTLETALNRECFGVFLEDIEAREKDVVARAKAFLSAVPPAKAEGMTLPETFVADDLLAVADGLESGYEKTVNVGNNMGMGDEHLESTTAYAARFIRAILAQQAKKEGAA